MSIFQLLTRGPTVDDTDAATDWDEFDLDAGLEMALRRGDWLEPSW